MAAWVLLLLPFSLASYGRAQYHSATFIAQVVVGFCLLFVFAAWEKWGTRRHFVNYELLKKRTVLGACCMAALAFFWAMVSVLIASDNEEAGQGDVARIAVAVGLLATTAGAIGPALAGDIAVLQLCALQFAGLLVSHLIMQAERGATRKPVGANDNSRAAARLLAMLAATDAKINRMTRQGAGTPGDFWR